MGDLEAAPGMTLYVPTAPPTASVSGTITDSAGSALSGITVTLVSSSGAVYKATTDGNGYYSFSGLQPGNYTIFRDQFYLHRGNNPPQNYRVVAQ